MFSLQPVQVSGVPSGSGSAGTSSSDTDETSRLTKMKPHVPVSGVPSGSGSAGTSSSDTDETSRLTKMKPHVPGIVIFADHSRPLPWSVTYHAVTLFADVSGFTSLCEKYSTMGQSGVDQLTRTLNEYLSVLVEGILSSDGDILKFAGDAILAIWRVGRVEELEAEVMKVVNCCLGIQGKCGEWDTDVGINLTVKIGVAAGEMSVTFLGNREYRHYVELGPAISAVNIAEHFCQSGMIVISPDTWDHCNKELFDLEPMEDMKHMRVHAVVPPKRKRSYSLPMPQIHLHSRLQERRKSDEMNTDAIKDVQTSSFKGYFTRISTLPTVASSGLIPKANEEPHVPAIQLTEVEERDRGESRSKILPEKQMKSVIQGKLKIGNKFGKLRKLVTTVTEMNLDIALRLYILSPVLKKIDDNQPLEYLSEMRQVSILFMNLVLDEIVQTDIEQTEKMLQTIFELVYMKTKAMHGSLNKVFLFDKGCTFLVIFGLPGYKHENDCAHALTCSGRMKSQLDKTKGVQKVSIGITTGTTFCGVVGHNQRHEYSVIGRKVNMAARLMMHYPDKITCDTETYQTCRLPPSFFEVLMTKRMKGLRNIGVIRQFIGYSKDETMVAKSILHTDYPILGRQMEEFIYREQLKLIRREENKRHHLVFSGPSGIGKTKVLDQVLSVASQEGFNTISCRVDLEDSSYPHFVANHVLRCLLSIKGYSDHIDREPYLLDAIGEESAYLYVLNDVLGSQFEKPIDLVGKKIDEKMKRKVLFRHIASECLDTGGAVVVIDDAQNVDTFSWSFLCELLPMKSCLIVLSIRPTIFDNPSCPEAVYFLEHSEVKVTDLTALDLKFVAPLACQMMSVCSIPRDLDKLLRQRSHGVPLWCLEILRDMLEKKELLIVLDDGRMELNQPFIAPNKALITTAALMHRLNVPSDARLKQLSSFSVTEITNHEDDEIPTAEKGILSDLGFDTESQPSANRGRRFSLSVSSKEFLKNKKDGYSQSKKISTTEMSRISVFAKGINAEDLPVPASMKELIVARIDSMRATDQLMIKCAAVLGTVVRRDILEILLPKAHRPKLAGTIQRLMESGIFRCSKYQDAQNKGTIDDFSTQKVKCCCDKGLSETGYRGVDYCDEPMFTHKLLQETAYEVLMESQRNELHTKAAHYLELSADELRKQIPFFLLFRPPEDDLDEKMKRIDIKLDDVEAIVSVRRKNLECKEAVNPHFIAEAVEIKSKRGRRQAVITSAEEAAKLVKEIAQGGKPSEPTHVYIRELIPIYSSLIYHWRCVNHTWNALSTLAEAVAASLVIRCNEEALAFLNVAIELLNEMKKECVPLKKNQKLMCSRIHRLHGQILYHIGDVKNAYRLMSEAASYLDLREPGTPTSSSFRNLWLVIIFFWCWRFRTSYSGCLDISALEQGYLYSELIQMDREHGHVGSKLGHAVKYFKAITAGRAHVHQVVAAYSSMIECCREKEWRSACEGLQWDLLRICACRKEELSIYDRNVLCEIFGRSCMQFFVKCNFERAKLFGKAAADICICVHDVNTTKMFGPYYFFLCLFRNEYQESIELLEVLRGAAKLSPDEPDVLALYHVICIEIALAGGKPPENIQTCVSSLKNFLQNSKEANRRSAITHYAISTITLWFARCDRWSESQLLFDNWQLHDVEETSLYSLMGDANCLQCMMIMLTSNPQHDSLKLREKFKKSLKKALKQVKYVPVLDARLNHLKAYSKMVFERIPTAKKITKRTLKLCSKRGNVFEQNWLKCNQEHWFGKTGDNLEWKEHAEDCWGYCNPSDISGDFVMFRLPNRRTR